MISSSNLIVLSTDSGFKSSHDALLPLEEQTETNSPVAESNLSPPSIPWTESSTVCIFLNDLFTLLILRDGHLMIPCCLHIRFNVVGQTATLDPSQNLERSGNGKCIRE